MAITFRLVTRDDFPLLLEWHLRPHVERWWNKRRTIEEIEAHYGPTIDGTEPTDHYIALLDGEPIGMIQGYLMADYPDWAEATGEGEGVAGVDLFIGEEPLTGRGLGTKMLERFVDDILFARPDTIAVAADPAVGNTASMRAFEKAGFRFVREFVDPTDGHVHALVRRDRRS